MFVIDAMLSMTPLTVFMALAAFFLAFFIDVLLPITIFETAAVAPPTARPMAMLFTNEFVFAFIGYTPLVKNVRRTINV